MAQISRPGGGRDSSGAGLAIAGAIPGPVGAVAKGVGIAKSLTNQPQASQLQGSAIQRRLAPVQELPPIEDRIKQLQLAESIIPQLPREVQEEVFPPISQAIVATANEFKNRGVS